MCGIAGIVHVDGQSVDQNVLNAMTDALLHRGPDGRGTFVDNNVGLGHRRLTILDLTEKGAQPMISTHGNVVITYNGEIYNFREKRKELEKKGYTFSSECDTEVLLNLFCEYGVSCLEHLRGMFAFAIYDKKKKLLFCARDRIGQKPFKYMFDGNTFLFASEIKALRKHPQYSNVFDYEAIHHFLTMMYLPAPLTGFSSIKKLEAGHYLLLDLASGTMKKEQYWSLDFTSEHAENVLDYKEHITMLLDESVEMRMVADVPVGAFLSGGIDSSAVVTMMTNHSSKPVKTFSIGSNVSLYDEREDAELVAHFVRSEHISEIVTADIADLFPTLVAIYEEPYADASAIPTYLISQMTSKHVKVALTGDGGDENFAGYIRYPILEFSRMWERFRLIHPLVSLGTSLFHSVFLNTFSYRCNRFQKTMNLPWEKRYLQYLSYFTEEEKKNVYSPRFSNGSIPTHQFLC